MAPHWPLQGTVPAHFRASHLGLRFSISTMRFPCSRPLLLLCLLWPAATLAQDAASPPSAAPSAAEAATPTAAGNGPATGPVTAQATEQAAEPDAEPARSETPIAFDPAAIGLPGLPQPMTSPADFRTTLALIDTRLAERTAALEAAEAAITAQAESIAAEQAEAALETQGTAEDAQLARETAEPETDPLAASVDALTQQIAVLRELRLVVQRRASLSQRVAESEQAIVRQREQLAMLERDGIEQEPPFPVSLLDQTRAELALKQAAEDVAETRIESTKRRLSAAEKALAKAVRERRAARDQLTEAEDEADPLPDAEQEALAQALELARLQTLLARQQLAAAETALALARNEDTLAESQQAWLNERIAALKARVVLPHADLEQRLAELRAGEEVLRAQIEQSQTAGDQAEAELYRAQQQLEEAGAEADQAALEAWVETRQAQLSAARSSVDSLTTALANSARMQELWAQRYRLMNEPEGLQLAELLSQVITDLTAARAAKDEIEERLSALRAMQLAQTRRLRDPALSAGVREALAARRSAQEGVEGHGLELLETQDALIALLEGMRYQLEAQVEQQDLSLQLLQAQEALTQWWQAELLEIDDQSIRVSDLIVALLMFVIVLMLVSLLRMAARRAVKRRRAKSPAAEYGDLRLALSAIAGNTHPLFVLIAAFYVAMTVSGVASPTMQDWLWTALVIAFYLQLGIWANAAMVDYFNRRRTRQEMRDPSTVTGYGLMMFFVRVGVWLVVGVSLLAYFQYPIAGLVGALGVGSLAVAFAVQNILGDIFSSMAIILDKPFRVGDFIMSGDTLGVIEHIGVKTTRIRSLSGEQIVLSNSDLLGSRIHNYKHLKERRVVFRIGVVYQTPRAVLERIPALLREAVEEQPETRFDRAHFVEYGDFALLFEVVYYVLSPDYGVYMDTQQGINLGIHRRFEEAGIAFAYPTQELILRRGPALET